MTAGDNGDLWAYRAGELRHTVKALLDIIDPTVSSESGCVGAAAVKLARERLAESTETWQARAAADLDRWRR